jgi:RecB family exonuclease
MSRVLRWEEPAEAPSLRELDAAVFGSLLHRVLERLYRAHGAEIVAGRGTLPSWIEAGLAAGDAALGELLLELPLVGAAIREKERRRLHDAVRAFLEYDFRPDEPEAERRRFVDVERGFGTAAALALEVPGGPLHVRGYVDRLDATLARAIVRDVKSGRVHPREGDEAEPVPDLDVQLGLYVKVARALAGEWGLPPRAVGAYAYASGRGEVRERAFAGDGDAAALEARTDEWLGLARALLAARRFPPTPDEGDCEYCPFAPLCGSDAPRRSGAALAALGPGGDAALVAFRAFKAEEDEE